MERHPRPHLAHPPADEGDGWLKIPAIPIPVGELTPAEDQKEAIQPAPAKRRKLLRRSLQRFFSRPKRSSKRSRRPRLRRPSKSRGNQAEEPAEEAKEPEAEETVEETGEPEVEETAEEAEQPAPVHPDPDAFQRRLDSRYDELKWLYCEPTT